MMKSLINKNKADKNDKKDKKLETKPKEKSKDLRQELWDLKRVNFSFITTLILGLQKSS